VSAIRTVWHWRAIIAIIAATVLAAWLMDAMAKTVFPDALWVAYVSNLVLGVFIGRVWPWPLWHFEHDAWLYDEQSDTPIVLK
jgi:type III secretory pathway component EscT